jgi:hypothetical protein
MLSSHDLNIGLSAQNKKQQSIIDSKLSGYGFLAGIMQQHQVNQKKRKREEISDSGKFIYKFKEGHSKNFKRELTFDYFLI